MGSRAQVYIEDEKIYLYTHWHADKLEEIVKTALRKRWRWRDPEYLARIIFCQMVKGSEGEETGYGIGSCIHGDIIKLITINCKKGKVIVKETYDETEKNIHSKTLSQRR